jgi:predicted NUDIX family NTP pyrophosphohydrolase
MKKRSAGILMYKRAGDQLFLLLVHPGGPFWSKKDSGAWSIPKGEYSDTEDPLLAATREFTEETGGRLHGEFRPLGELVQPSKKVITAWAVEGDFDTTTLISNSFEMEWPPKSGLTKSFPEVDRAEWFTSLEARSKILPGQNEFIGRLLSTIGFVEGQPRVQLSLFG